MRRTAAPAEQPTITTSNLYLRNNPRHEADQADQVVMRMKENLNLAWYGRVLGARRISLSWWTSTTVTLTLTLTLTITLTLTLTVHIVTS